MVARAFSDNSMPGRSNGRRVRTSIWPARPVSIWSDERVLYTSMRLMRLAGTSCSARLRLTPVNTLRPFQVVVLSGRPRMAMPSASPPPRLVTCTPVTRCRASMTLLSGSLPMSSATIDSMHLGGFFLVLEAFRKRFANAGDDHRFHFLAFRRLSGRCLLRDCGS